MALIKDSKGRGDEETDSGYVRITGNKQLGNLISKYHATAIRTGNKLEDLLADKLVALNKNVSTISISNLNKNNRVFKGAKNGHDAIVDCVDSKDGFYKLIELKDGDTFDTKKVDGELKSLESAKQFLIGKGVPAEKISKKFCSFNAISHEQVKKGAKGLLEDGMAMTGKELCDLLGLDYDKIIEERKSDQEANLDYFVSELKKIPEIRSKF